MREQLSIIPTGRWISATSERFCAGTLCSLGGEGVVVEHKRVSREYVNELVEGGRPIFFKDKKIMLIKSRGNDRQRGRCGKKDNWRRSSVSLGHVTVGMPNPRS
ncbi:hypothetical protein CDAR_468421 [Caerostris darwini]|uniref:Uncharacterized protein n=1 Tax=Caerostris darwini TaxID=1538125 RepID=A0AAV4Q3Q0_9ARAC|nr:hypothetical protein CDAR_468421 [Caerostris darwini]